MATSAAKTTTSKSTPATNGATSKAAVKARGAFTRGQTVVGLCVESAEAKRLSEDKKREANWKRWGPYLSERQWATVREDYSPDGSWCVRVGWLLSKFNKLSSIYIDGHLLIIFHQIQLGLLSSRPRSLPYLSLGGGWFVGHL